MIPAIGRHRASSLVKALLHFDGANGSTTITDATGKSTWAVAGGAALSTAAFKFGTASMSPNGSGGYVNSSNVGNVGTGDFCIEGFADSTSSTSRGIFHSSLTNSAAGIGLGWDGASVWQIYHNGTATNSSATSIPSGWFHWAVYRKSGTLYLAINGVVVITVADSSNMGGYVSMVIGAYYNSTYIWAGYIDEVRLTYGSSPYTSAGFTPPSAPFTYP